MTPSQDPATRHAPSGASRTAVLEALRRSSGSLTIQELAEELGLHGNTVRFHLTRLVSAGLVSEGHVERSGPGRPKLGYTAIARETAEPSSHERPGGYQLLAQILAGHLAATSPTPEEDAIAAGQEWGRYLAERPPPFSSFSPEEAFDKVTGLLESAGFEPDTADAPTQLRVYHCPFRTVADERPNVACSVHLGLMRGVLAEMDAPLRVTDLEASHTAEPCLALFEVIEAPAGRRSAGAGTDRPAAADGAAATGSE